MLNGRTEVPLKSFWGQVGGTFALENPKKESTQRPKCKKEE